MKEVEHEIIESHITKRSDGKFSGWDETESEIVTTKDTIEEVRSDLEKYARTLG